MLTVTDPLIELVPPLPEADDLATGGAETQDRGGCDTAGEHLRRRFRQEQPDSRRRPGRRRRVVDIALRARRARPRSRASSCSRPAPGRSPSRGKASRRSNGVTLASRRRSPSTRRDARTPAVRGTGRRGGSDPAARSRGRPRPRAGRRDPRRRRRDRRAGGVLLRRRPARTPRGGHAGGHHHQPLPAHAALPRLHRLAPLLGLPQGIAVFQNGVRINEPFGDTVQFDLLPQFAIEQAQLSAGVDPAYGLNAMGGALALQLKDGFTHTGFRGEFTGGAFGRTQAVAEYGANNGAWAFLRRRVPLRREQLAGRVPVARDPGVRRRRLPEPERRRGRQLHLRGHRSDRQRTGSDRAARYRPERDLHVPGRHREPAGVRPGPGERYRVRRPGPCR